MLVRIYFASSERYGATRPSASSPRCRSAGGQPPRVHPGRCRSVGAFSKGDKIGEGTYGSVYQGRDKVSGALVALKRVKLGDGCTMLETVIVERGAVGRSEDRERHLGARRRRARAQPQPRGRRRRLGLQAQPGRGAAARL